ncbi:MAG: hypothetical protein NTX50_17645 [Candidatus Sumerlaeota bacterium]|nr:hypothetical protein [Candidatus Sumerlaeota bacterium]
MMLPFICCIFAAGFMALSQDSFGEEEKHTTGTFQHSYWLTSTDHNNKYGILILSKIPIEDFPVGENITSISKQEETRRAPSGLFRRITNDEETTALIRAQGIWVTIYDKDSIWNDYSCRPFRKLETLDKLEGSKRRLIFCKGQYQYEEASFADVLRILKNPEGHIPIHRLMGPDEGAKLFIAALLSILKSTNVP